MKPQLQFPSSFAPVRFARVLFRGLLLGCAVSVFWPAGCASSGINQPNVGVSPGTIEAPRSRETLPFLPHPAFALASSAERVSIADIAERVTASVVSVSSERDREMPKGGFGFPFFHGPHPEMGPRKERGFGSGVIVSDQGIVLTNNHVIDHANEIQVTTGDGREFDAELVGADAKSDLAVLRLKGDFAGLTPVSFGDSARLRLGDIVLAIGNPFGVGQTVTMGIVSAKGRADVGIADYEDFIQTDAAINPGNSGGALVDMEGNLVGINTAILSRSGGYQGIGFAIPTNMARPIMDSLLEHGRVVRGYLGVGIQDLSPELRDGLGVGNADGVLISSVEPGGAAAKAGVQRGDVVTEVDGVPVNTTGRLRNLIGSKSGKVRLGLLRAGSKLSLEVTLGELPDAEPSASKKAPGTSSELELGISLAELTPQLAQQLGIERKGGVVIVNVVPGSAAAEAGVRPGDALLEVDKKGVQTAADAKKAIQASKGTVLLLIERAGRTRYVGIKD